MPVYEYECLKCKKNFEAFQKLSEKPLKKCSFCGGPVQRLISQTSFSLKGGGWYKDGYASTKTSSTAKTPAAPEKKASKETSSTSKS